MRLIWAANRDSQTNQLDKLPDAIVATIMSWLPPRDLCRFSFTCPTYLRFGAECAAIIASRLALPSNDLLLSHLAAFAESKPSFIVLAAKLRAVETGALRSSSSTADRNRFVPRAKTTLLMQCTAAGERVAITAGEGRCNGTWTVRADKDDRPSFRVSIAEEGRGGQGGG